MYLSVYLCLTEWIWWFSISKHRVWVQYNRCSQCRSHW